METGGPEPSVERGATFVLRVWLLDRPGALGAVASRIGAVGGDLLGIEIIDRGAGRVVDELTVRLPDADLVDLLVSEIHDVEDADVEDVRELPGVNDDLAVQALRVAAAVHGASDYEQMAQAMVGGASSLLRADWSAMVDLGSGDLLAAVGDSAPDPGWLAGFVHGVSNEPSAGSEVVDDLAFAHLRGGEVVLAVGRTRPALRGRERALLDALCGLAGSFSPSSSHA